MSKREDLEKQRAALDAEIAALEASELESARVSVLRLIEDLGYTFEDLFGKKGKAKTSAPPKYRGPNGETWSGGRGRRPDWLIKALADGAKLENFAI